MIFARTSAPEAPEVAYSGKELPDSNLQKNFIEGPLFEEPPMIFYSLSSVNKKISLRVLEISLGQLPLPPEYA
ncbi:Uncharacterised protein [Chlamydia trachomatis]|nr:Uncharacterised protein [Chlamydia trachomatis]